MIRLLTRMGLRNSKDNWLEFRRLRRLVYIGGHGKCLQLDSFGDVGRSKGFTERCVTLGKAEWSRGVI